jgi:translation elongation factor EF-Ts
MTAEEGKKLKEMRDRTALPFRECRRLLKENAWDVDRAIAQAIEEMRRRAPHLHI